MDRPGEARDWIAVRLGRWLLADDRLRRRIGGRKFTEEREWMAEQFGVGAPDLLCMEVDEIRRRIEHHEERLVLDPGLEIEALGRNLATIDRYVPLTEVEREFLVLVCFASEDLCFNGLIEEAEDQLQRRYTEAFSMMLGIGRRELLDLVRNSSRLSSAGLVDHTYWNARPGKTGVRRFRPGIPELGEQLLSADFSPDFLVAAAGRTAPEPELTLRDFPHLNDRLRFMRDYLATCLKSRRPGVNIFLHGPPGTGKTQITRLLGKALRCPIFESLVEDSDGDPLGPARRIEKLRGAMNFLRCERKMVVFDEAEDLFRGAGPFVGAEVANQKGWMNAFLESNPLPIIWAANSGSMLDPAFARRFDMVLEVPVPPRQVRRRIIRRAVGRKLSGRVVDCFADVEHLSPAVVRRAVGVVNRVGMPSDQFGETVAGLVSSTMQAQGHDRVSIGSGADFLDYDPALVNASTDLSALCEGLRERPAGRLCLQGPPGTGKSEFGRWLARSIGLPLQATRLSDLLAPYVGQTERHIANTFQRAREDGSLLLIDEVDSLLHDRRQAVRSWEVNQVNEFLTRMEEFDGLLVATTNLVDRIDPAAARRFDLTIRLDYMTPAQAASMLALHCRRLGLGKPTEKGTRRVETLGCLTPGDFATVCRRHRFAPLRDSDRFVEALVELCATKPGRRGTLGFRAD